MELGWACFAAHVWGFEEQKEQQLFHEACNSCGNHFFLRASLRCNQKVSGCFTQSSLGFVFFSSSLTLDRRLESIKFIPLFLQCWENLVWLKFSKLSWCIFQLFIPCTFSDLTWRIMALKFPQWETFYMAVTKSLLVRIYTLEIVPGKRSSR